MKAINLGVSQIKAIPKVSILAKNIKLHNNKYPKSFNLNPSISLQLSLIASDGDISGLSNITKGIKAYLYAAIIPGIINNKDHKKVNTDNKIYATKKLLNLLQGLKATPNSRFFF